MYLTSWSGRRLIETPARAGRVADLGRDVRVPQQDAVRRAGHHPEQDEVQDDDQEDRPDGLDDLAERDSASPSRPPGVSRGGPPDGGPPLSRWSRSALAPSPGYSSSAASRRLRMSTRHRRDDHDQHDDAQQQRRRAVARRGPAARGRRRGCRWRCRRRRSRPRLPLAPALASAWLGEGVAAPARVSLV